MVGSNQPTKETDYGREIDGKPLLIKGEPGTGKTMLAQVVAEALGKRGKHEKLSPVQGASLVGAFAGALLIIKPTLSNLDLGPRWSDCWEDWAPALPIRWCGSWASGGNGGLLLYLCFQPFPAW